jgi:uncharacterized protein YjbI with pentapeptide repeats
VANRRERPPADAPKAPLVDDVPDEGVALDPDESGELADARIVDVVGDELDDLELVRCVVEGVRLTARSARRIRLVDVVLRDCELSGVDLGEASHRRVRFERCRAEGLDAGLVRAADVVVVDSKLTGAGLRMSGWERARFDGCDLRETEWAESTLQRVEFASCDLTGADVSRVRMEAVRFRSTRLDGVKGARALGGATIDALQVIPVALSVFADLGIRVADDEPG